MERVGGSEREPCASVVRDRRGGVGQALMSLRRPGERTPGTDAEPATHDDAESLLLATAHRDILCCTFCFIFHRCSQSAIR
jgi:hypothetical protein